MSPMLYQREILTSIAKSPQGERERSIVKGNRELIRIYAEKSRRSLRGRGRGSLKGVTGTV